MYTVIGSPKTRTMRVLWALEEIGVPYEHVDAAPRSKDAFKFHPDGKVPSLSVDGESITDSVAIVQFLADRHDAMTEPAGTIARARQDSATQFCVDEIEGALWTAAKNTFALPEEHRVPEIKRTCRYEFDLAMGRLEKRLGDGLYIMGDAFTVPDLLIGHCAGWAEAAKFELPSGPVGAYFERVRARPALRKAMRAVS